MSENMDRIEALFEDESTENIILSDEKGDEARFEPIALVNLGGEKYAILAPLDPVLGIELEGDEAIVFVLEENDAGVSFSLVTDEQIVDRVFELYDELWEEEGEE